MAIDDATLEAIRAVVGGDGVSTRAVDLLAYSSDLWPRNSILRLAGELPDARPDAVAWPRTPEAAASVLSICAKAGVPVVPVGGGSGVCGGTVPVMGGLALDLKRMNRLLSVDTISLAAVAEAGTVGQHLEDALNARGFTLGHFPSSIMCSTLGGWISTRSAGQYSSRYGKVEDMVLSLDLALPSGSIVTTDATASHPGSPDWCRLALGAEGTLGLVVRACMRIHPLPEFRRFLGFRFLDLDAGLEAMRAIMQAGLQPLVMRLYDPLDTLVNNFSTYFREAGNTESSTGSLLQRAMALLGVSGGHGITGPALRTVLSHPWLVQQVLDRVPLGCMLVLGFEGEERRTRAEIERARELAVRATGRDLGPGPGEHWYRNRYSVSFHLPKVFGQGAFAETIEVASLWRDVPKTYEVVRSALSSRVAVMAHFSHAYRDGCAIYFTLAGTSLAIYDWAVRMAITSAMSTGATVSHHHGVGLMKRAWTAEEYRGGERLFGAIKAAIDPAGIMNPHKVYSPTVLPDGSEQELCEKGDPIVVLRERERSSPPGIIRPEVPEDIPEILRALRREGQHVSCQAGVVQRRALRDRRLLDLSGLSEILEMDPVSGTVTVQAGLTVYQIENYLREKGFTLGYAPALRRHLPVGEYLATASPGERSPLYGAVVDCCIGISGYLADGTPFSVRPAPRRATGPDLMHCLIGGHGALGVITAACLRIFPLPAVREAVAYGLDDPALAVSLVRSVLMRDVRPEWTLVVMRAPSQQGSRRRVRMVFQFGGSREAVSEDLAVVRDIVGALGLESEPAQIEDRMALPSRRARVPSVQRFLPIRVVLELLARLGEADCTSCPEAHVTHFGVHGATLRLLLRENAHIYPKEILEVLEAPEQPEPLKAASERLKRLLDPEGVLNSAV